MAKLHIYVGTPSVFPNSGNRKKITEGITHKS